MTSIQFYVGLFLCIGVYIYVFVYVHACIYVWRYAFLNIRLDIYF